MTLKKKMLKPGHLPSSQGLMGIGQPWVQNWTLQACHIWGDEWLELHETVISKTRVKTA